MGKKKHSIEEENFEDEEVEEIEIVLEPPLDTAEGGSDEA